MTGLLPLAIRPAAHPAALRPAGAAALPIAVTTAARALDLGDELRLWINGPDAGETAQLRFRRGRRLDRLPPGPPLPIVLSDAVRCREEILAIGADARGRPLALGVSIEDGSVIWRREIEIPSPLAWPVPGCSPRPVVAWWEPAGTIVVAEIVRTGLGDRHTFATGGPPLVLSRGGKAFWAAWGDADGIHAVALGPGQERVVHLPAPRPSEVAAGLSRDGLVIAWTAGDGAFLVRFDEAGTPAGTPAPLDLADAAGGTLRIVSGPEPLVWAQRGEVVEGEPAHWVSSLVFPGLRPLLIDGLVHDVVWWGEAVVVVGSGELRLFERAGEEEA
jgi:hypothetical protein